METTQLSEARPRYGYASFDPQSVTRRLTGAELLEAFPEARQIVPSLLKEFRQRRDGLAVLIADGLAAIKSESSDESYRYFWRTWLKLTLGEELQVVDRHISRLSRQLRLAEGKPVAQGTLSDDMIQTAREVPIEDLLDRSVRRSGHDLVCPCPFHDERTPSFRIYTQKNRGWCFGCNTGGDSIGIYQLLHGCDFKEAVLALTGGSR